MPLLTVIERSGARRVIEAEVGRSLMEALRGADVQELLALCGGCCSCGTCHVYVDAVATGALPPVGEDEDEILKASAFRRPESRLSCQIRMSDALEGLRVTIAPYG